MARLRLSTTTVYDINKPLWTRATWDKRIPIQVLMQVSEEDANTSPCLAQLLDLQFPENSPEVVNGKQNFLCCYGKLSVTCGYFLFSFLYKCLLGVF